MEGKGSTAVASTRSKRNALSLRGRTIDRVSDSLDQKHEAVSSLLEEGIPTPPVESPMENGTDVTVFAQPDPKHSTKRASGRLSLRNKISPSELKVMIPPTPPPSAYPTPSISDSSAKVLTSRTRTPPARQGVATKKSDGSATSLKRGERKETPKKAKGKKKAENNDTCGSCGGYGQLVCCDACPAAHHLNCLSPDDQVFILQANADDPWYCADCAKSNQGGLEEKYSPEIENNPTPKTRVPSFISAAKRGNLTENKAKNTGNQEENGNEQSDSENEFDAARKPKPGARISRRTPAAGKPRRAAANKITEKRVEKDGSESDEESDGPDGNVSNDDDMVYGLRNPAEPESDPEEAGRHGIEYAPPPPPTTNENEEVEEIKKEDPWADEMEGGNGEGVSDGEAAIAAKKGIPVRKGGKRRATPKERQDSKKPKPEEAVGDEARPVKSRVSGPRSALTSFLEEKGISARDIRLRYFQRIRQQEEADVDAPAPAPAPENGNTDASANGSSVRGGRNKRKKEEVEEEKENDSGSDLKLSDSDDDIKKAKARAKVKGKPTNDKKQSKGKGKKGKKGADSDPDSEAEDDNRPALMCISCGRQLPRNILMSDIDPTHPQCGVCVAAVEKRRMGHSKKQRKSQAKGAVLAELMREIPTLQNMCIKMISNHITDVESFGDVPGNVMEAICKIICRHRQLTVDTLQLFLENEPERVIFPDCAKLNSDCFKKIAFSCPTLTTLRLEECGRITDEDVALFASQCPNIKVLILQGPYLVSDDALADAISKLPNLEEFEVGWSPKVGPKTLEALGKVLKLKTAGFTRCSRLTTEMLLPLTSATSLKKLTLKETNVTDQFFEALLPTVGGSLAHIDVTGCRALTDVFVELVAQHCPNLEGLAVEGLKSLTDQAVILLASGCPKITHLNLRGCFELTDESVRPLLTAYGKKIVELTVACLEMLSPAVFEQIADSCHFCLVKLDVSWCRCVEDEVLERIIRSCKRLKQLSIWGCHRVTECSWRKAPRSLSVLGGMHI